MKKNSRIWVPEVFIRQRWYMSLGPGWWGKEPESWISFKIDLRRYHTINPVSNPSTLKKAFKSIKIAKNVVSEKILKSIGEYDPPLIFRVRSIQTSQTILVPWHFSQ